MTFAKQFSTNPAKLALATALCGALILLISFGVRQSYGLFLTPLSEKLDLGRESFSLAVALANLFWGLAAPFTGRLADKYGPLWILLVGTIFFAGGFWGLGIATSKTDLVICGVLMGLGLGATGVTVVIGTVARVAGEQLRDKMITIASVGSAIGLCVAIPFVGWLLGVQSLDHSLFVMAIIIGLIGLLAWPMAKLSGRPGQADGPNDGMVYVQHGLSNRNFLLLMAGFFVCGFHIAFTAVHLPAYLEDATGTATLGTYALMLIGLGNIFGTLLAGMLGEHYSKAKLLSVLYFLRGMLFLGFLLLPISASSIYILSFLMGLLWLGTIPLTSGLVAEFYGAKWLSMLFGLVFLAHQVGAFFGSWLGGIVFDINQSYDLMWIGAALLAFASALLHLPIEEKSQFDSAALRP